MINDQMIKKHENAKHTDCLWDKLIWLFTVGLFLSIQILQTQSIGSLVLAAITGILFILILIRNNGKIYFCLKPFHLYCILFILFCYTSTLLAVRGEVALERSTTVLEIFICMFVLYLYYGFSIGAVNKLLKAIMWSGHILSVYALLFYGLEKIQAIIEAGDRLNSSFANVNTISMLCAIAMIFSLYDSIYCYKHITFSNLFFVPEILIIAATASKKASIIVLIGLIYIGFFVNRDRSFFQKLLRILIFAVGAFLVFRFLMSMHVFDGIISRWRSALNIFGGGTADESTIERSRYIKAGLQTFFQHPIFGIGIGSSGAITVSLVGAHDTYLHNNYVELLACGGIIGFLFYYSSYIYLLWKIYRYRNPQNICYAPCIILLILLFVLDYSMVTYFSKNQFFYMMLLFIFVEQLEREEGSAIELQKTHPGRLQISD